MDFNIYDCCKWVHWLVNKSDRWIMPCLRYRIWSTTCNMWQSLPHCSNCCVLCVKTERSVQKSTDWRSLRAEEYGRQYISVLLTISCLVHAICLLTDVIKTSIHFMNRLRRALSAETGLRKCVRGSIKFTCILSVSKTVMNTFILNMATTHFTG